MGILMRIKSTIFSLRKSLKRFPVTICISSLLAFLLIYMIESQLMGDTRESIQKICLILGLGIPLSLCIRLLIENFFEKSKLLSIFLYIVGGLFLILYYYFLLDGYGNTAGYRYFATMIFFALGFLYIPRIGKNNDYEYYILDVIHGFFITFIYSFVLFLGISIIFLTIDQLFDINIKGEIYLYLFLIITFIFAISLFLSKLPSVNKRYGNIIYNKSLTILLTYIVIPLISIYTLILYVYFGKILVTWEWPRGLVSHLVLWYSTFSVGVIFLLTPIFEENKIAKLFKKLFPKIILPVLIMMFMSIYQRVSQYGITENRYYIIILGLWVLGIMIYFSVKKQLNNILIPISLSIVVLISVYGPLSSFSISKYSQNMRFEKILRENNMLLNGNIVPKEDISLDTQIEISNIINYFERNHNIKYIKSLPKDFTLDKMEDIMGFKYNPYSLSPTEIDEYFFYNTYFEEPININGFHYFINMSSWQENEIHAEDLILKYDRQENSLIISKGDKILLQQDILGYVKDIYEKQKSISEGEKNILSYDEMTYEASYVGIEDNLAFKFIFRNISGKVDKDNNIILDTLEFILLIGER